MLLLIWETNPEGIDTFVVPTDSGVAKLARKSSGHMIGTDIPPWSEVYALSDWVASKASEEFKHKLPIKKHAGITQVVHAGIVL